MRRSPGEAINTSRFRSSTSNRISRAMSPHSGGGEGKHLTMKLTGTIILSPHCRLSNENVSSVYDDRLDKVDPEGTLQPRQRRWAVVTWSSQCVTLSLYHPMVLVEWQQSAYKLDPPPICDIWIQQKLQYYIAHCIPELYTRADADGACSAGYYGSIAL